MVTASQEAPAQPKLYQGWKALRAHTPKASWTLWYVELSEDGELLWIFPVACAQVKKTGKTYETKKTSAPLTGSPTHWETRTWHHVPSIAYALALAELG